ITRYTSSQKLCTHVRANSVVPESPMSPEPDASSVARMIPDSTNHRLNLSLVRFTTSSARSAPIMVWTDSASSGGIEKNARSGIAGMTKIASKGKKKNHHFTWVTKRLLAIGVCPPLDRRRCQPRENVYGEDDQACQPKIKVDGPARD